MAKDKKTEIILITKRESKAEEYKNSEQAYQIFKGRLPLKLHILILI